MVWYNGCSICLALCFETNRICNSSNFFFSQCNSLLSIPFIYKCSNFFNEPIQIFFTVIFKWFYWINLSPIFTQRICFETYLFTSFKTSKIYTTLILHNFIIRFFQIPLKTTLKLFAITLLANITIAVVD